MHSSTLPYIFFMNLHYFVKICFHLDIKEILSKSNYIDHDFLYKSNKRVKNPRGVNTFYRH